MGGFPMRVVSHTPKGNFTMEVTSVEQTPVDDAEFSTPDGWQKFSMAGFMPH
jgi:hypothetical protein